MGGADDFGEGGCAWVKGEGWGVDRSVVGDVDDC